MMDIKSVSVVVILLIPLQVNSECEQGFGRCEWESWGHWSSCSRTCAGFRTRRREICCGIHVPDCISRCQRPNSSVETEPCETHCPHGGSYIDGICHCPPLRYGVCCERNETNARGNCARHCTWTKWHSWSGCDTNCGCGKRTRQRSLCCLSNINGSCADDCNMYDTRDERTCTAACPSITTPCELCSWNGWQPWTSCSQECGGGERSRSRTPCCCSGQSNDENCMFDCGLSLSDAQETNTCGQICHNQGSYVSGNCSCTEGFAGPCCQSELTENCTKCSLHIWNPWSPCSQACGAGQRIRTRGSCCRRGQDVEECTRQCSLDADMLSETEVCTEMCCGPTLEAFILTGTGSALGAIVLTTIVTWYIFQRCRRKQKDTENVYERPTFTESTRESQGPCFTNASYEGNKESWEEDPYKKIN